MTFAMCVETMFGPKRVHAKQLGIDHAVVLGPTDGVLALHECGNMLKLKKLFDDAGRTCRPSGTWCRWTR